MKERRYCIPPNQLVEECAWMLESYEKPAGIHTGCVDNLEEYQRLIWDKVYGQVVPGYDHTPEWLARLCHKGLLGQLHTNTISWIIKHLNTKNKKVLNLCSTECNINDFSSLQKMFISQIFSELERLNLVLRVTLKQGTLKPTKLTTPPMQHNKDQELVSQWVFVTVDFTSGPLKVLYCDSSGLGYPADLADYLSKYTKVLQGVSVTKDCIKLSLPVNVLRGASVTDDCIKLSSPDIPHSFQFRHNQLANSKLSSIISVLAAALATLDWPLFEKIYLQDNYHFLCEPVRYETYLRRVIIHWIVFKDVDVTLLKKQVNTSDSKCSGRSRENDKSLLTSQQNLTLVSDHSYNSTGEVSNDKCGINADTVQTSTNRVIGTVSDETSERGKGVIDKAGPTASRENLSKVIDKVGQAVIGEGFVKVVDIVRPTVSEESLVKVIDKERLSVSSESSVKVADKVMLTVGGAASVKVIDKEMPSVSSESFMKVVDIVRPTVSEESLVKVVDKIEPAVSGAALVKVVDITIPTVSGETLLKLKNIVKPTASGQSLLKLANKVNPTVSSESLVKVIDKADIIQPTTEHCYNSPRQTFNSKAGVNVHLNRLTTDHCYHTTRQKLKDKAGVNTRSLLSDETLKRVIDTAKLSDSCKILKKVRDNASPSVSCQTLKKLVGPATSLVLSDTHLSSHTPTTKKPLAKKIVFRYVKQNTKISTTTGVPKVSIRLVQRADEVVNPKLPVRQTMTICGHISGTSARESETMRTLNNTCSTSGTLSNGETMNEASDSGRPSVNKKNGVISINADTSASHGILNEDCDTVWPSGSCENRNEDTVTAGLSVKSDASVNNVASSMPIICVNKDDALSQTTLKKSNKQGLDHLDVHGKVPPFKVKHVKRHGGILKPSQNTTGQSKNHSHCDDSQEDTESGKHQNHVGGYDYQIRVEFPQAVSSTFKTPNKSNNSPKNDNNTASQIKIARSISKYSRYSRSDEERTFACKVCSRLYSSRQARHQHYQKYSTHKPGNAVISNASCLECPFTSRNVLKLIDHYNSVHKKNMKVLQKVFKDMEEFEKWKTELEKSTYSKYAKKRGAANCLTYTSRYLFCHRSGTAVTLETNSKFKTRERPTRKSNKMNNMCTSFIKVLQYKDRPTVFVNCCLDHFGHSRGISSVPLSQDARRLIAKKLSEGMSIKAVIDCVRDKYTFGRDSLVTKKDVYNVKKSLENNKIFNVNVTESGAHAQPDQASLPVIFMEMTKNRDTHFGHNASCEDDMSVSTARETKNVPSFHNVSDQISLHDVLKIENDTMETENDALETENDTYRYPNLRNTIEAGDPAGCAFYPANQASNLTMNASTAADLVRNAGKNTNMCISYNNNSMSDEPRCSSWKKSGPPKFTEIDTHSWMEKIMAKHTIAETLTNITKISHNVWTIGAAGSDDCSTVRKRLSSKCPCLNGCPSCSVCFHMYSCTCPDYQLQNCEHIHAVHMSTTCSTSLVDTTDEAQTSAAVCLPGGDTESIGLTPKLFKNRKGLKKEKESEMADQVNWLKAKIRNNVNECMQLMDNTQDVDRLMFFANVFKEAHSKVHDSNVL